MSWHSGFDLSDEQVSHVAHQVVSDDLGPQLLRYNWHGTHLAAAWAYRLKMEDRSRTTPTSDALLLADEIHRWGFKGGIPRSVLENPDFLPTLQRLLTVWKANDALDTRKDAKISSLAKILSIKQLGIAKVSKWICFNDQKRYAIYDSRVSLALRNAVIDGKRAFPIIAREAFAGLAPWYSDSAAGSAWKMAHYYWNYLRVVNRVAEQTKHVSEDRVLYAAEVEMALFMLGDVWPDRSTRLPLFTGPERVSAM